MLDEIRRRLAAYEPRQAAVGERPQAAVLLPLYAQRGELHVVLTKRTEAVKSHKGEISFPGGSLEAVDRDLVATALRESDEEIGLRPADVEVIGRLDDMVMVSRFHVTAYVGMIAAAAPYAWQPQVAEVAAVIEVPLCHLLDPANRTRVPRQREGEVVYLDAFRYGEHLIWGATARILRNFIEVALTPAVAEA
jgi:8-oxo-dGTP pyrophosphatase MutT (NUDIX family)